MDRRRSGIPGPSGSNIPKRAPSPSHAAFGSSSASTAARVSQSGPLGAYRPPSRGEDESAAMPSAGAGKFGFGASNVSASQSSIGKGHAPAQRVAAPPSSLLSKRTISNAGLQDQPNTPSSNGSGAHKRPFLTSANANGAKFDHLEGEYKRKELLAQQAYERLQQELSAKGREVEKEREERLALLRQWDSVQSELQDDKQKLSDERKALKDRLNALQTSNNDLSSRIDAAESERASAVHEAHSTKTEYGIRIANLEAQLATAQANAQDRLEAKQRLEKDVELREAEWEEERKRVQEKRGDDEESAKLTSELSALLSKCRTLEADNMTLRHEGKQLQARKDSVEALKEQKRDLEKKVGVVDELRRRLAEAEAGVHARQAEKEEWSAAFSAEQDSQAYEKAYTKLSDPEESIVAVESPSEFDVKEVSRFLSTLQGTIAGLTARSRILSERAIHARKQCSDAEETSRSESERAERLAHELDQAKTARLKSDKARETMTAEVEGYRSLLESYHQEAQNMSAQYDSASAEQIRLLESQLQSRSNELDSATRELDEARQSLASLTAPGTLTVKEKNRLESEHEARQKELLHTLEEKQVELTELEKQCVSLGKANDELFARLGRGEFDQSKLRCLELSNNPVSQDRVIRTSALDALRKENAELLEQLKDLSVRVGQAGTDGSVTAAGMIPAQTLENLQSEYDKLQQSMRDRDKAFDRLKEAFGAKATEYVAAVKPLFGYDMHVLSRGKVKLRSVYARTAKGTSLTFDAGEEGDVANMRLVGEARQGAANVATLKKYWLGADRSSVPCFLAALQLELYESTTQAVRVGWTEEDET